MSQLPAILQAFVPTARDPFDLRKAGHLYRRAAFGASLAQRQRAVKLGVGKAVAALFEAGNRAESDGMLPTVLGLGGIENLRAFRVFRMLSGEPRLGERMSYFWHDHFATSNQKVKNVRMMGRQQQLFDQLGLSRFDELLLAVSKDPAMVRWLDNETNVRGRANENYARELFELFTLGEGNYTENDIKQAARAFTGWHLRGESFRFRRGSHDSGEKVVFGKRGRFGGEDIVAMAVAHPAAAPFMAGKILRFFVHPTPTPAEIKAVAALYVAKKRHIGETLRVLLRSCLFFSSRSYRSKVKSPADYVVGVVRSLGAKASPHRLSEVIGRMGQVLLEPPNVAGWKGERAWITSASWLLRMNFAAQMFQGQFKTRPSAAEMLPQTDPVARANAAIELLLDGDVEDASRRAIHAIAKKSESRENLIHAVLSLPEGQML